MMTMTDTVRWRTILARLTLLALAAALLSGCSIRKMAVRKVGDALSAGGSTFASDDDPELVRAAVPFSLKLMESLLAEVPDHEGLLLATASGFTQFGYAFVQLDADELETRDVEGATAMRERARKLYLRARNYGLRGLNERHRDFEAELRKNPKASVAVLTKKDVPLVYWTAMSWAAAISVMKDSPDLIADLGIVEALMDRALQLDESFDQGALHGFFINYEMTRKGAAGDAAARAKQHFERAVELSQGKQAAPYVTYAEAVMVQKQNRKEFEALLQTALAINPDADPSTRLINLIMQKRARWLLSRTDELFLN